MRAEHAISIRYFALLGVFIAAIVAFTLHAIEMPNHLQRPEFLTGYVMFGIMLLVALLNVRKKLSMVPIGRAAYWLAAHAFFGVMLIGRYFIHTQTIWPDGGYERAFALLVYLVTASGLFGYALQRVSPRRLAASDLEIIYERIPAELSDLRRKVQTTVLESTKESGSDTLGRHYLESLSWYFRRPRFFIPHLFGLQAGQHWIRFQVQTIERYLSPAERAHLAKIEALAQHKDKIDLHYALQSVLKYWLVIHVPLAAALIALMFWHIIVVNVYAL